MDDDCSANHLIHGKAVSQKQGERIPVVSEQRRQISGVMRVLTTARIVMRHGIRERVIHVAGAVTPFVNVKPKYPLLARGI